MAVWAEYRESVGEEALVGCRDLGLALGVESTVPFSCCSSTAASICSPSL